MQRSGSLKYDAPTSLLLHQVPPLHTGRRTLPLLKPVPCIQLAPPKYPPLLDTSVAPLPHYKTAPVLMRGTVNLTGIMNLQV